MNLFRDIIWSWLIVNTAIGLYLTLKYQRQQRRTEMADWDAFVAAFRATDV